jgi:hypothetical protein
MNHRNLLYNPILKVVQMLLIKKKQKNQKKVDWNIINGIFITSVHTLHFFYENEVDISKTTIVNNNPLYIQFLQTFLGVNPSKLDMFIFQKAIKYLIWTTVLFYKPLQIQKKKQKITFLKNLLKNTTELTVALNPNSKILMKRVFYTYRLTCLDLDYRSKNTEIYYMGYRSTTTLPIFDVYYSSSKKVKKLVASLGKSKFSKKILGLYSVQETAIKSEILYHRKLRVSVNVKFLNQASQLVTSFSFDNTGRINTPESNQQRSVTQLGKPKMTPEGKASVSNYQKYERIRTPEQLEKLSSSASALP